MTPVPLPKTDAIVSLINKLNATWKQPSEFDLARLDRLIAQVENADTQASLSFRGVYHALRGDAANAVNWSKRALEHDPTNPDVYNNYAGALLRLGKYEEAVQVALDGINKCGMNQSVINILLHSAYYNDDQELLRRWLPEYEKLTGWPHEVAGWLEEDAEDLAELPQILAETEKEGCISLDELKRVLGL